MTNPIPNVSTLEEIENRYETLNLKIQRRLTDHYNHWLGLHLIAYGDDWQREDALGRIKYRVNNGRSAFPVTPTRDDFVKRERDKFSEGDITHLRELQELRNYANLQVDNEIPREGAQLIYNHLVIMLYGNRGRDLIPHKLFFTATSSLVQSTR